MLSELVCRYLTRRHKRQQDQRRTRMRPQARASYDAILKLRAEIAADKRRIAQLRELIGPELLGGDLLMDLRRLRDEE